jgi:hypothetical protein
MTSYDTRTTVTPAQRVCHLCALPATVENPLETDPDSDYLFHANCLVAATGDTATTPEHTCHAGPTCYDEQADLDGRYAVEGGETCGHPSCQQMEHEWDCPGCQAEDAAEVKITKAAEMAKLYCRAQNNDTDLTPSEVVVMAQQIGVGPDDIDDAIAEQWSR